MNPIPREFYVTPYYRDPMKHESQAARLEHDAARVYDHARRGDWQTAWDIMGEWGRTCLSVKNAEARFILTYWGSLFLEAFLLTPPLEWDSTPFMIWVDRVYRPCAWASFYKKNNHGSWGIMGTILAHRVLGWGNRENQMRLLEHIEDNVAGDGSLPRENLRKESGPWYYYFSLAPMLRSCQLLNAPGIAELLRKPLWYYFRFCQAPELWPHRSLPWPLSVPEQWLFPHSKKLLVPKPHDWPGNLYLAAGRELDVPEWVAWARPPFYLNIFRERE